MPLISSILVGVAQGCSTTGYVSAPKKLATILARVTPTANVSTIRSGGGSYPELFNIQYANRVSVPLCRFQN